MTPTSKIAETARGTVSYVESGSGPALVLLHGIGSGAASWADQVAAFSDRYRVVAWDAPGYGASDRLAPDAPNAAGYAETLAAFLDSLDIDRCHLVGHSLGALMACAFTVDYPGRVLSLMIADPAGGYGAADEALRNQRRDGRIRLLEELGPEAMARERHGNLLSADASREARDRVRTVMSQIRPDGYRQAVEMLAAGDIRADAAKIALPVAVVVGGGDTVTPPDACRQVAGAFPDASFEILPGLGHASYVEGPEIFNAALQTHLEKNA